MIPADQLRNLLDGTWITIQVTLGAAGLGTLLALVFGVSALARSRVARAGSRIYVEFFRGVSAIILLFWVFFALPVVGGPQLSALGAGIMALGLNMGAYGAEIVRTGIGSVPVGQSEAAIALNLTSWQRLRYVTLPQAIAIMLPPYGNLLIEVLKGTSLVSLITLSDLTFEAQKLRTNRVASSTVIFATILVIYFALAQVIAFGVRRAERVATRHVQGSAPR